MQGSFDMKFTHAPEELTAYLAGDLDLAARDTIVAAVTGHITDDVARVVIDLGSVTFCDSSGLSALLDIKRHADRAGASLTVRSVPEPVARILELADVGGWLRSE